MTAPLLHMRGISKHFPPNVQALDDVDLMVRPGEVHCLLGANGAGKSTLLKIIAGAYRQDTGEFELEGRECSFASPQVATRAGISMIYQELDLIPQMTVAENLYLGHAPRRAGFIRKGERRVGARASLDRIGARFGVEDRIESLSLANQQLTAIARSLTLDSRLIIMDEPSAALNAQELDAVFDVIRDLVRDGRSVLYVSHRLHEILEIGDRVTVLRNGRNAGTFSVRDVTERELVDAVVGENRSLVARAEAGQCTATETVALRVENLAGPAGLDVRGLDVRRGEVVGLAGLNGAGRTTLFKCLFGEIPWEGTVSLGGAPFHPRRPRHAIERGVALVPESRKTEGLILNASVYRNAILPYLRGRAAVNHRAVRPQVHAILERLRTRFGALVQPVGSLSGGNQQKVVLAKWSLTGCTMLLLDEPSRGLDVGAKADLYQLVQSFAVQGVAVLVASSELEEIYANCDRIWVLHEGVNTECFDPGSVSCDEIERAMITGRNGSNGH